MLLYHALGQCQAQAVNRRLPTAAAGSISVGFVLDKLALGQVSPSTSVSLANSHCTKCSTLIYHPRLLQ
jgi:hypothetical protein